MIQWLNAHETLLWWVGLGSLLTFVGTLIVIPVLVIRLPSDYFISSKRPPLSWRRAPPPVRVFLRVVKNIVGLVLTVLGVVLLFLPGQGLLTLLVGILLLDFPGKYGLEQRMAFRPSVLRAMNWIRSRAGVDPIRRGPKHPECD